MEQEEKRLTSVSKTTTMWKYTTEVIDANNVNNLFVTLGTRRDIRRAHVAKIRRSLEKGEHFDAPLVTNKVKDKHRLIDGNHRLEAMKAYFAKYPQRKIEVAMCVYDNLNDADEKAAYTRWNLGAKQSVNDFTQLYWNDLKFPQWWVKNANSVCRLSHKGGKDTIGLSMLLAPYFSRANSSLAWAPNGEEFVGLVKQMKDVDYKRINEFLEDYVQKFGKPAPNDKGAIMWQQLQFWTIAAVYWRNQYKDTKSGLWNRLFKASHDARFIVPSNGAKSGARDNLKALYDVVIEAANRGIRGKEKMFLYYSEQHAPKLFKKEEPLVVTHQ